MCGPINVYTEYSQPATTLGISLYLRIRAFVVVVVVVVGWQVCINMNDNIDYN